MGVGVILTEFVGETLIVGVGVSDTPCVGLGDGVTVLV